MSNQEHETDLMAADELAIPHSTPPSIESLTCVVKARRQRRKTVRRSFAVVSAAACFAIVVLQWPSGTDPLIDGHQVAVQPAESTNSLVVEQSNEVTEPSFDSQPRMQLYARVRGQVPVFQIDRETNRVNYVGWIESQRRLPIDMRYVPSQQQATFNAVLHHKAEPIDL